MIFESKVLSPHSIKINGTIKKAIEAYRTLKVSMKALLTDFLAVKSKGDVLADADNPWAYYYKGIEGHEVESGVSVEESLFRFAAMELKRQKPTDVINAAFYANNSRNDGTFELGYVLPLFSQIMEKSDRVLIINPSPYIIEKLETMRPDGENCYVVTDDTVAALYRLQFPNSNFRTFEDAAFPNVDVALLLNRDQKIQNNARLLKALEGCVGQARVLTLVPSSWFDSTDNSAYAELKRMGFAPKQMLIVDRAVTASSPRKKVFALFEKTEEATFELYMSSYDVKTREFSVIDNSVQINTHDYFETKKTILAIWKSAIAPTEDVQEPQYKKPERYDFSNEITIFYSIYSNRKNRVVGVANYRKIENVELKTFGRKISPDIERGLRHETKEEVISSLEGLVFDESLYALIRTDIEKNYVIPGRKMSLKTIWHYCWIELEAKKKYDHEYVTNIMSANPLLGDIYPYGRVGEDILRGISESIGVEIENIPYKAIEQISLILDTAEKKKMLMMNPLQEYVLDYTRRATERQQDVRNALVKKHFSSEEESVIFKCIIAPESISGSKLPRYAIKSLWLSAAIRLFTGMAIREVAALCWGDYQEILGTNKKQFTITKFVDEKGNIIHHGIRENWKRFRIVPVVEVLALMLDQRMRYLVNLGIDRDYLKDCPIILQEERLSDMIHGKRIHHCKPTKISEICNTLIKQANIAENNIVLPGDKNELVSDFNKYHGDIFLSNFQNKANHVAYMTMGEINYMIGVNPPDTLSKHYSDYTNDFIQIGMIQKLRRWCVDYESLLRRSRYKQPHQGEEKGSFDKTVGPFKGGIASIDVVIDNRSGKELTLITESDHGIDIQITEY